MKMIFALFWVCLCIAACTSRGAKATKFESAAWKQGDYNLRGLMIESLVDSGILAAKTRHDIIEIIGAPDDTAIRQYYYRVDLSGHDYYFQLRIDFDSTTGKSNSIIVND